LVDWYGWLSVVAIYKWIRGNVILHHLPPFFVCFIFLLFFFITMSLSGRISSETGVHATAAKMFSFFTKQLHHVQNITDRIHKAKLHDGHDWHHNESIKQWTYIIGKFNYVFTLTFNIVCLHSSLCSSDYFLKTF